MSAHDDKPSSSVSGKATVRETPAAKRAASYTIPEGHPWAKLWIVWAVVAAAGLVLSGLGFTADPKRFAFSYLAAFAWGLTLCLGALFFVLLQHLTGAGWSVVVRRGAEQLMGALPLFAVLVLPILFVFRETLYPWAGHAAHEPLIHAKSGYLNVPFWTVRAAVYFAVWVFFSYQLFSLSRRQDETGDPRLTLRAQALSAPGMLLFALSLTFAGIDWLMSLEPEWFSTMFGVYIFAGSVISIMAFLCLLFSRMRGAGLLAREVSPHHFHDLGKLLFAFTVFWAYISFSQYFLIWYANIPEETDFFHHRQQGGWGWVGIALVLGHFFTPFFMLLSRHAKRFAPSLQLGAIIILVMHYVDLYWLVMPNVDHHLHPAFYDAGPLLLVLGAMLAITFRRMLAAPVMPVRDPRLDRSLEFENALGRPWHTRRASPRTCSFSASASAASSRSWRCSTGCRATTTACATPSAKRRSTVARAPTCSSCARPNSGSSRRTPSSTPTASGCPSPSTGRWACSPSAGATPSRASGPRRAGRPRARARRPARARRRSPRPKAPARA